VKPENIMIRRRDRIVKVLDFGLSKLTEGRDGATDAEDDTRPLIHTETGVALGTVAYMSPEQLRGARLDARSDVWSLGVVLYEMVAGRRPFQAPAHADLASSILRDDPAPLPRDAPERLKTIIGRALDKDAGARYTSVAEMLAELRGLTRAVAADAGETRPLRARTALGANGAADTRTAATRAGGRRTALAASLALAAAVAAVAAASYFYYNWTPGGRIDSLAVLPFLNVGGSPDAEYLSDGITDSLINSLSQLPNVRVMSRNSVFRFKGGETDAQAAANALNVRAVLTGRVRQHGDALSLSVELVDARDNSRLWGAQYNRRLADIITVQEEIAKEISEKLRLRLTGEEQKLLTRRYTDDTEAYQLYLKCTFFWNKFTPEAERTAIDYCTQAIVKDPNFALPYAGMVHGYQVSANNGWMRPHDAYPKAKAAMTKGLELDPNNASLLTAAASTAMFYDWDWAAAERGFKQANEVEPNYWHHHELYAYLLTAMGRAEEAFAEARRAQELDPLSRIAHASASHHFFFARQYDRSTEEARKALELDPGFPPARQQLARSFVQQGKHEEAIAEYKQTISISGHTSQNLGELGHAYAVSGRRAEALKLLDELKEMSGRQYVSPLNFAFIYVGLGDKEQAMAQLEKAYQERTTWLMWIKVDPRLDPLRPDPRFAELLRRMNLAA
jgi:TolB-like protein/Flp pilus assembly protein TadD